MSDVEVLSPPPPPPPILVAPSPPPPAPSLKVMTSESRFGSKGNVDSKTLVRKNLFEIQRKGFSGTEDFTQTVRNCLSLMMKHWCNKTDENSGVVYFSFYRPLTPVVQHGPSCGLAALCMALNFLYATDFKLHDVLGAARNLGFTKQGEIFSAANLLTLAQHLVSCNGSLVGKDSDIHEKADIIMRELRQENVILIPYDKDSNHEPCLKRGQKAHWALLTGFLTVEDSEKLLHLRDEDFSKDEMMQDLCHLNSSALKSLNSQTSDAALAKSVYAFHGQSLRCRLWSIDDLLASNTQLVSISSAMAEKPDCFVLPSDGIESGLCDQFVILSKFRP